LPWARSALSRGISTDPNGSFTCRPSTVAGRKFIGGEPMKIYERPVNLFVAGFLGNPAMNLLRGRLGQRSGTVLEGDGAQLSIPALEAQAGQEIVAGIRPEDLHIVEAAAAGALAGTVELVESIGSEAFIHVNCGAWKLIARSSPYNLPAVGTRVALQPAAERIHFFEAGSGKRLEP
jgi:multiple sugar transport system ATP-binding protein